MIIVVVIVIGLFLSTTKPDSFDFYIHITREDFNAPVGNILMGVPIEKEADYYICNVFSYTHPPKGRVGHKTKRYIGFLGGFHEID